MKRKLFSLCVIAASLIGLMTSSAMALDRNMSTISVNNTTTETSIYTVNVPSNLLNASGRGVHLFVWGTYTNNSGANRTLRVRLKFGPSGGTTTILDKTSANVATSGTAGDFYMEALLFNAGTSSSQAAAMRFERERGGATLSPIITSATAAVDSTQANLVIDVTVAHSNATATINLTKTGAITIVY